MPIINRVADLADEVTGWRQDFHAHPELLYEVHRTAGLVAERLRDFGCDEVVTGIGRTGVVGVIKGKRGKGGSRAIGLRADMDALPINETADLPYRSESKGVMHACGHDGHTAMLLGAAKYLAETRNFDGDAVMIFQPAEEGGAGGKAMVEDGLMERFGIEEVYGMHNWPGLPVGQFALRPGPIMAAGDRLEIHVEGRGGHAAEPHKNIDTVLVAAQIVVALQSIVARNVGPLDAAVISICTVEAGTTGNVMPQTAVMRGTVRTLNPAVQKLCEARITTMAESIAAAYGAKATVDYQLGYPATINHEEQTEFMGRVAGEVAPIQMGIAPQMASEDFSYMLNARPGAYIFIGNGDTAVCHHPAYNFDDGAIPAGISMWARLIEERLGSG